MCGGIFCDECSFARVPVQDFAKAQRVCRNCFLGVSIVPPRAVTEPLERTTLGAADAIRRASQPLPAHADVTRASEEGADRTEDVDEGAPSLRRANTAPDADEDAPNLLRANTAPVVGRPSNRSSSAADLSEPERRWQKNEVARRLREKKAWKRRGSRSNSIASSSSTCSDLSFLVDGGWSRPGSPPVSRAGGGRADGIEEEDAGSAGTVPPAAMASPILSSPAGPSEDCSTQQVMKDQDVPMVWDEDDEDADEGADRFGRPHPLPPSTALNPIAERERRASMSADITAEDRLSFDAATLAAVPLPMTRANREALDRRC